MLSSTGVSRYLLDTHALIWAAGSPERLSVQARDLIAAGSPVVSLVSLWELVIKRRRASAPVLDPLQWWARYVAGPGIEMLPVRIGDLAQLDLLPDLHKDPFDRMLIAQAVGERIPLVTNDPHIQAYPVKTIW